MRLTDTLSYGDSNWIGDERLATTAYTTANTTEWIIAAPKVTKVYDGSTTGADLLSQATSYYDNQSYGTVGSDGLLTKTVTKLNATENAVTKYIYDTYGRIDTVTDNAGDHVVDTDYHATYGYVTKVTNAGDAVGTGDHVTEIVDYDPGFGLPIKLDDPNDNRITADYDEYGRLTKVWLPTESTSGEPTIKYEYTLREPSRSTMTSLLPLTIPS